MKKKKLIERAIGKRIERNEEDARNRSRKRKKKKKQKSQKKKKTTLKKRKHKNGISSSKNIKTKIFLKR